MSLNSKNTLDEIDSNPNSTTNPLPTGLFNNANKEYIDFTRDGWVSGRMILYLSSIFAQRIYIRKKIDINIVWSTGVQLWTRSYYVANDYKNH